MSNHKLAPRLFIEGEYKFRNLKETNWATPINCPSITTLQEGKTRLTERTWSSTTALNTPDSLHQYAKEVGFRTAWDLKPVGLTESEKYELFGLVTSIAHLNDAWGVVNHGNHGTSKGIDITDKKAADAILLALQKPVIRANELLAKIKA